MKKPKPIRRIEWVIQLNYSGVGSWSDYHTFNTRKLMNDQWKCAGKSWHRRVKRIVIEEVLKRTMIEQVLP